MSSQLTEMESKVLSFEEPFNEVNRYKLNFKTEANFALQILKSSDFLRGIAQKNQDSLFNAITNLAMIGITLNPARKEAYLVPRGGSVCLDISAIGLIKLATDSGSILWGQAKLVYKNDEYESRGISQDPLHKYNPFGDRGEVIGVYVVVKTHSGDFLTEEMSLKDCHAIRDRSEAWKAFKEGKTKSCPWQTDEGEMMKKTVIKRAQKYWPKSERVEEAIHMLNQHEGIDFESERTPAHLKIASNDLIDEKTAKNIRDLIVAKGKTEERLIEYMNTQFGNTTKETKLKKIEEFNSTHSNFAYRLINTMENK